MFFVMFASAALALGAVPQMPSNAGEPDRARAEAAIGALVSLDFQRVQNEPAYAQSMLAHVDVLAPTLRGNEPASRQLLVIRSFLLDSLDRRPEALAIIEAMLAEQHSAPDIYLEILAAAGLVQAPTLMVRSIEGVARTLGSADPTVYFDALEPSQIYSLGAILKEEGMDTDRARLAEALIAMGWQRADPSKLDHFRLFLLDRRISEGRRAEAAQLAREISGTSAFLPLLVSKRYDGLIQQGGDLLRQKLEEEDRGTASLVQASPSNIEAVLDRAIYLRTVGRNADAIALLQPYLVDVRATVQRGEYGPWIINEAAGALIALGRNDEAQAVMRRLVALDFDDHPDVDLIGPNINYAGNLWQTNRAEESLAHLERITPLGEHHANEYGRLWIASHTLCAKAMLDRREGTESLLDQLRTNAAVNGAALNQALLCLNDLDGSERFTLERLSSDNPDAVLLALQDFAIQSSAGEMIDVLRARLGEVRDRPAVRAAIERVGRVITLPVDRAYHGGF